MTRQNAAMQPLTHHEVFGLVAPFSRRGRLVDLAASDRAQRRLDFRPVDQPAGDGEPALRDSLRLENPAPGEFHLTRTLQHPRGLAARLEAEGSDPAELLDRLSAIDPHTCFRASPAHLLAFSHRVVPGAAPVLSQAELLADGLRLHLKMPAVAGYAGELRLSAPAGQELLLPDDLLAVLGRDWDCLVRDSSGWRGHYAARGKEPQRSRRAEAALAQAAGHLAATLAEPPARYHARLAGARWRVALRRSLPMLVIVGLVGGSAAVPSLGLAQDSTWRMLIFNAPPLLVAFGLCLREIPRFELPRWPRRLREPHWSRPVAAAASLATPAADRA